MTITLSIRNTIAAATLIAIGASPVLGTEAKAGQAARETTAPVTSAGNLETPTPTALCREAPGSPHRVSRFGTTQAVSRTPTTSKEDLAGLFAEHRNELEAVLRDRGLEKLAKPLAEAIATGSVTERSLEPGEVLAWMASRPSGPTGKVEATGPLCLATPKSYPAWAIDVELEESLPPPKPDCEVAIEVDCDARSLRVRTADGAAADGAAADRTDHLIVSLGEKIILNDGETLWEGALSDPFTHHHVVTARAQNQGTKTVTTHHFVIPQICLNLALVGSETRELAGDSDACEKKYDVARCQAPPPHCAIRVAPEAWKNEDFDVEIDGHKDVELLAAMDDGGREYPAASPMSLSRPGHYTLSGRATNETGETAECSAEITIKPRWTLRAMGERLDPDTTTLGQATVRSNGVSERTRFSLGTGSGIAVGLEYLFNDLLGLEGRLNYGELDTTFTLDLDDRWETAEDSFDLVGFSIGPTFHLTRGKRVDFFTGPVVSWIDLGDLRFDLLGETIERDLGQEFALGVQMGLDVPLGRSKPWRFHIGLRYLDLAADVESVEIDLDPLSLALGIAYGF